MADSEDSLAEEYRSCVQGLFQHNDAIETRSAIESVLQVEKAHPDKDKAAHFAALETAFRESFYETIVRLSALSGYNHKLNTHSLLRKLTVLPSNVSGLYWTLYQPYLIMVRGKQHSP